MSFKIIGISGKLGVGKDYITDNFIIPKLQQKYKVLKLSLADQLKIIYSSRNNVDISKLYDGDKTMENRIGLQQTGTLEKTRYGNDIWIKYLEKWMWLINKNMGIDCFIIPDIRYVVEADWISKNGVLIRVCSISRNKNRLMIETKNDYNKMIEISAHLSETELDTYSFKNVISNEYHITPDIINNNITKIFSKNDV